ncbi:MAG: hypothetical protein ACFFA0_14625 [Promethearchaeota archaeon]
MQSLAYCPTRELILGNRAYVCQVCALYDPVKNNRRFSDIYEESKKIAEKKIEEKKIRLEEFELAAIKTDDEIDLSIDEFEEEDEEVPLKFEKRKAGKADLEDSEEFTEVECPFCGELFDDLPAHIRSCEFAPDDVTVDDIMPSKKKKRKTSATHGTQKRDATEKQKCPYCGKEFVRLGRHLTSCPKRPADADDEETTEE